MLTDILSGVIYNRALYLDERRKMMQWWADYLDSLREEANIILLKRQRPGNNIIVAME